jgi:hypothetical protein
MTGRVKQTLSVGAAVLASVLVLASAATARTIRVDTNSTPETYEGNGQFWPATDDAIKGNPSVEGSLPFGANGIDFGPAYTNVTDFCLHEDGFVAFSSCGALDPNAVLRPLAADWASDPDAENVFEFGSVTYSTGQLDPAAPFVPLADAPRAIRFHWNLICTSFPCNGNPEYSFQAILIDVDGDAGGDFDLEFNYGGAIPAGTGVIGFVLGANTFTFNGDVESDQSFDFQFRGGRLVGDVTEVPEPATWTLFALALLALPAFARRRLHA